MNGLEEGAVAGVHDAVDAADLSILDDLCSLLRRLPKKDLLIMVVSVDSVVTLRDEQEDEEGGAEERCGRGEMCPAITTRKDRRWMLMQL